VRTWAPRGQTPVLQYCFNWKTLSAVAGVTFWNFYFQLHPGSIRAPQVVEFLDALKRQVRGPLLVIRDRMLAHRSALVRRSVEASRGRIVVKFLPAYAPELNPVEYLWGYWKQHELANVCPKEFWQLGAVARMALKNIKRKRKRLIGAFWQQAELCFE
jgi:transposase